MVMVDEECATNQLMKALRKELEEELFASYGPLMTGVTLWQALGYPSHDAFRQALNRKTVPVHVFDIEHRRGLFCFSERRCSIFS